VKKLKGKYHGKIKSLSTKRASETRTYSRLKRAWMSRSENQICHVAGCGKKATDLHHSRGRIGRLLNAEEFWMALCRTHHNFVHSNPSQAREMGLLPPIGQWNTFPR
jgi:hypothetical protein